MPHAINRALRFAEFGGLEQLSLVTSERPEPGPGQIRVRVAVAGLNPVDWQILASPALAAHFGVQPPTGYGNDFAGVVDAVGAEVTRWRVGDRVFGGARARAAADYFLAAADDPRVLATPSGVTDLVAGVIDIVGRTASAVADRLRLGPDDTVLIGSAAGGVGTVLTQLAVATGARVLGSGSPDSAEVIRSLGAEPVRYGAELVSEVRRAAPSGITAAADLYGVTAATAALELGATPGRVVTIEADDPPVGAVAINGRDARPEALPELLGLVASGRLRIPVEQTFPLADYRVAIERQQQRHTRGKLALVMAEPGR
ncbi:NADP-dependent oxidoreductase [Propionicimonas paludicola]|nr:NADP-dependent oxidoreductase [Propionicimonas paludicola]